MIGTNRNPLRYAPLAAAMMVLLCSGFRSAPDGTEIVGPPMRPFTRSVVCVDGGQFSRAHAYDVQSPVLTGHWLELDASTVSSHDPELFGQEPVAFIDSLDRASLDPHAAADSFSFPYRINLRLTQHSWQVLSLFGRNLAADLTSNVVVDTMSTWSGAIVDRFIKPATTNSLEWVSKLNLRPVFADQTPVTPVAASTFSAAVPVAPSQSSSRGSLSPSIADGRMPSLASSMGSVLDPAMGLDDISRGGSDGLMVGLRIERPLDSRPQERGVEVQVVPGLPLDEGL